MTTLSVVLATFNEKKNLPDCLNSVKNLADEVIIVDGSSTDNTAEIAKGFGARVKITTNKPIFHINKQMAIDMATKDWVLQLDADEIVTPKLANEIRFKIQDSKSKMNGYWIPRKNWFLGRFLMKGGQYPDYTLRLYRRGKGKLPQKDVHEQAIVIGQTGYLKEGLLHYPYRNFKVYLYKWDKYTDLLKAQIEESLKNTGIMKKILYFIGYVFVKPAHWFLTTYIRHKGFMDLWPGFVFSFFSAIRFPVSYFKYLNSHD